MSSKNTLFLALTETWLTPKVNSSEISIKGYKLYRSDRDRPTNPEYPHGGACIYVREDLQVTPFSLSTGEVEIQICHIPKLSCFLAVIYRPPKATLSSFQKTLTVLSEQISSSSPDSTLIVMGDFNFPSTIVEWQPHSEMPGFFSVPKGNSPSFNLFEDFVSEHGLTQVVGVPTTDKNILDLVLINEEDMISDISVSPIKISDHYMIEIKSKLKIEAVQGRKKEKVGLSKFCFEDKHWPAINLALERKRCDLISVFEGETDLCKAYNQFLQSLEEICLSLSIPILGQKDKGPHIIPKLRQKLFKKRALVCKSLRECVNPFRIVALKKRLEEIDSNIQISIEAEVKMKEDKAIEQIKTNPKAFYSFANARRKYSPKTGPLVYQDKEYSNDLDMANIMCDQFCSVFTTPTQFPLREIHLEGSTLEDIDISEEDVVEAISQLNRSSSPGPDGVTCQFLMECKHSLAPILVIFFRKPLEQSDIPDLLKLAIITPLYKGGSESDPANHRPVSVTSNVSKVEERVTLTKTSDYLLQNSLLPSKQHGFMKQLSTVTQLIEHISTLTDTLEHYQGADVLYLDFAKAYDKVDFGLLIQRLSDLGIRGKVLGWINAFLRGRKQKVKVNGVIGKEADVISGIPQGTILGPLLFILFIAPLADLPSHSSISSYADDTKLIIGRTDQDDFSALQGDLNLIYSWVKDNNMAFNSSKFKVMSYGDCSSPPVYKAPGGEIISQVESIRDLGVTLQTDGKYDLHIHEKVSKASQVYGWVMRVFKTRERYPMLILYKALILPHLDYCSLIWSPSSALMTQKLERVQRLFTRNVSGFRHFSYWERLSKLNMMSVERRMERYQILYLFKCLHQLVPNPGLVFKSNPRTGIHCQTPLSSPTQKKCAKAMQANFVMCKGPKLFNCPPKCLRKIYPSESSSLNDFKRDLDDYLKSVPDQPTVSGLIRPANSNSLLEQQYYNI